MFKELFTDSLTEEIDKNGVMDSQAKSLDSMGFTRVYLRKDGKYSALDSNQTKMPFADQDKVIGFFATKANNAGGYVIQELNPDEKKEFGKDAYRVYSNKGTTVVKFNLQKGKVYFLDNEYYTDNDKVKYQSPINYTRLLVDDNRKAIKAMGV